MLLCSRHNSDEQHLHDFKRDEESKFCFVCQESWPMNETSVSKYNKCSICGKCFCTARDVTMTTASG